MKKILVPVDFSDNSVLALSLAHQIAVKNQGKVTLLHVMDFPMLDGPRVEYGSDESLEEMIFRMEKIAEERISSLLERQSYAKDVTAEVQTGPVLKTILQFEKDGDFDLMVVGISKGATIGDYLFGTFTDKLVHKASSPVLVTKGNMDFAMVEHILMGSALRLKDDELQQHIQTIRTLSKGSLELVRINTPSDFMSQDVFDERVRDLQQLPALKNCDFTSINFKNPADGLIYQATKSKADMIVIGDKNRSTFRRWIVGEDLAEKVMDFSSLPVLIL